MTRHFPLILSLGVFLNGTLSVRAQDDARAIIENAIKAQGSAERAKFKGTRIKSKGTVFQGEMEFKYTDEEIYKGYDKVKSIQEIKFDGGKFSYTVGFDGQKAWMKADAVAGLDESEINLTAYILNELYLSRVARLTSLLKFGTKPAQIKETEGQKCEALIRSLGAGSFAVREKASQDLIALGEAAVLSLVKAQKSGDLEVARRAERCLSVICSKDIYFELSLLPEIQVDGKPAQGVRVRSRGHKDIQLYFDKKSHLLVKLTRRFDDPMTGEAVDEERIVKEYQEIQGIQTQKKVVSFRSGKKYIESELIEAKYLEKVDDREFVKP